MKFLKWILSILGIIALIAGGIFLYTSWLDIRTVMAAIRSYNNNGLRNPTRFVFYTAGLAAVGGLLLGWGIGLPSHTGRGVRKAYRADLESQGLIVDRDGDGHPDRDHA